MLALPLPGASSSESNVISSPEVPGLLPGVSPVEPVEEEVSSVLVLIRVVEEAEELEEDEERGQSMAVKKARSEEARPLARA